MINARKIKFNSFKNYKGVKGMGVRSIVIKNKGP